MKIIPVDRQSLIDIAIQTSGGVAAAFELSARNGISLSETINPGIGLEVADVVDRLILSRYQVQNIQPATELSGSDKNLVAPGGIGFMSIEIDFRIEE